MNIKPINNISKNLKCNINFKENNFVEYYVKTPYEIEMDNLYKQAQNQIEMMKFLYKNNSAKMKQTISEISQLTFQKAEIVKTKYLNS